MLIKLVRLVQSDGATLGMMIPDDDLTNIFKTIEPAWRDNNKNISCVPEARYLCRRIKSAHHGEVFQLMGVQGRDNILIHVGNSASDTKGCILIGEQWGRVDFVPAVLESKKAFARFMALLSNYDMFDLWITSSV